MYCNIFHNAMDSYVFSFVCIEFCSTVPVLVFSTLLVIVFVFIYVYILYIDVAMGRPGTHTKTGDLH